MFDRFLGTNINLNVQNLVIYFVAQPKLRIREVKN